MSGFIYLSGEQALVQWEQGREVVAPDGTAEVHFAHFGDKCALAVATTVVDDKTYAPVPNQLLTRDGTLNMWAVAENKVLTYASIPVLPRAKPVDYVDDPTEVIDIIDMIENLNERVTALESEGIGKAGLPAILSEVTVNKTDGDSYAVTRVIDEESNTYAIDLYLSYTEGGMSSDDVRNLIDERIGEYEYYINENGHLIINRG